MRNRASAMPPDVNRMEPVCNGTMSNLAELSPGPHVVWTHGGNGHGFTRSSSLTILYSQIPPYTPSFVYTAIPTRPSWYHSSGKLPTTLNAQYNAEAAVFIWSQQLMIISLPLLAITSITNLHRHTNWLQRDAWLGWAWCKVTTAKTWNHHLASGVQQPTTRWLACCTNTWPVNI